MAADQRTISGTVVRDHSGAVAVGVIARAGEAVGQTTTDAEGHFSVDVPAGQDLVLEVAERGCAPVVRRVPGGVENVDLTIDLSPAVPTRHESVVIVASVLDPSIDRRNGAVYRDTLFTRDDQIFHTLDAGISAGQHEGGGKSVEIRRFGFNLDHGGVSGGLKVLVDDVPFNQPSQGHAQGYLGQLKSVTPELIEDVDVVNGPFSAQYGDFSGLGVVHIRLRESLADPFIARLQTGSFGSWRAMAGWSPRAEGANAFVAYEGSGTDGPFVSPLRYRRDNFTANYTRHLDDAKDVGIRLNVSRNDFFSSGQIPLDEVAAGHLDRFGYVDPYDGGRVRSGLLGLYFRKTLASGDSLKVDAFALRSLFDLYSDFTFFLSDPVNGDGIQQHDSRLREGATFQWLHANRLFGRQALLTVGSGYDDNHVNLGLSSAVRRSPIAATTLAHVNVGNLATYVQENAQLSARLRVEGGVRLDLFRFALTDRLGSGPSGTEYAARVEPKASLAFDPVRGAPVTLHLNYGRGIASQDARGVVQRPSDGKVSTTDFYQLGLSSNNTRVSATADLFFIDRSNEQVFVADSATVRFAGPSRAYGFEAKTSIQLARPLALSGGVTRVMNAYFRGTTPRVYVDSAPHTVANGLTLDDWHGFTGSLRYRHLSSYRLSGTDASIRAAGSHVADLSVGKRITHWAVLNVSVDNVANVQYFETQSYFESRLRPGEPALERIHGTPGYPRTLSVGVTLSRHD